MKKMLTKLMSFLRVSITTTECYLTLLESFIIKMFKTILKDFAKTFVLSIKQRLISSTLFSANTVQSILDHTTILCYSPMMKECVPLSKDGNMSHHDVEQNLLMMIGNLGFVIVSDPKKTEWSQRTLAVMSLQIRLLILYSMTRKQRAKVMVLLLNKITKIESNSQLAKTWTKRCPRCFY